ncbi:MAG: PVC-type heme-binding CxxCH protein, partial [Verrucomicrobiota bacterium]
MKTGPNLPEIRRLFFPALAAGMTLLLLPESGNTEEPWETRSLLGDFYSEDASAGDLDGDEKIDLVYGPFWWQGPDFENRHRFAPGEPFDGYAGYSDNFFNFVHDIDGDDDNDIIVFGFPGQEVRLYLNPGNKEAAGSADWEMHQIVDQLAHESPHFIDLVPGGLPEIVGSRETRYGFYAAGDDPTQPWTWHPVSAEKRAAPKFGHGFGVGDVDGDGLDDIIERSYLYLQPEDPINGRWKEHKWASLPYGGGGAQILVDDVDGDGDADLITSLNAHAWGIAWFEQFGPGKFKRHDIIGESSTENPYGVAFSQPHAMALADMDGDGRNDFITGKRYMAHRGKDPGGLQDPVVYWFRNVESANGIEFVPHFVDDNSGVGVGLTITDLNADGALDIISGNKRGLSIHLRDPDVAFSAPEKWATEKTPQDQYQTGLSPEEAVPLTEVPEGFSVDLIAAEPDLTQPIAMTFDACGRIWVIEGHTYPVRDEGGYHDGKDRILIFEDSDADGSFETRKVFAENINLASGIEVGFGGVYVGAAPYLLFYPDKDQNDLPDGEPEILLDGWGYQDTHETLNAFTWGPDGWLYGCHGVFTHSKVGKPGTPDDQRQPINAGLWRFHPVSKEFQVYAHGSSNPW